MGKNSEEKRNEVPGRYATACREGRGKAGRRRRGEKRKERKKETTFYWAWSFFVAHKVTRCPEAPKRGSVRGTGSLAISFLCHLFSSSSLLFLPSPLSPSSRYAFAERNEGYSHQQQDVLFQVCHSWCPDSFLLGTLQLLQNHLIHQRAKINH